MNNRGTALTAYWYDRVDQPSKYDSTRYDILLATVERVSPLGAHTVGNRQSFAHTSRHTKARDASFDRLILVATSPAAVSACHRALASAGVEKDLSVELLSWLDVS